MNNFVEFMLKHIEEELKYAHDNGMIDKKIYDKICELLKENGQKIEKTNN